ncbi:MAG: ornithine cyclodeaminase family protein [Microbacterium sp.]|uniref:ornithine cyclodeaminase family protein n=1 Tax=Microbacterium sp. TaxID=51671 RepID=UPI0039E56084
MVTTVLTSADCEAVWEWEPVMTALRAAHVDLHFGRSEQPVPQAIGQTSPDARRLVPMIAAAHVHDLVGVKMLVDAPANRPLGLPAQRSTAVAFSSETGECIALVDGMTLTRLRTAAVTAIATDALARPDSRRLGLVGAGALARAHLEAIRVVRPVDEVVVWSRSARRAAEFVDFAASMGVSACTAPTPADAAQADVVCTLTPSTTPLLTGDEMPAGTHVNALGSPPRPVFRELAPRLFAHADRIVVDVRDVALAESGNIREALNARAIAESDLVELGTILAGEVTGRAGAGRTTVFNSVGVGLQDLAAIYSLLPLARRAGVGQEITLR